MNAPMISGGGLLPPKFPRMAAPPVHVGALAYYHPGTPGLEVMRYLTKRKETVPLVYPDQGTGLIGVPRTLAPEPETSEQEQRSIGGFMFEAQFTSDLRPEQEPFVQDVFRTLEEELGCIGEAPTGFGKTTTGCYLATHIGRPICVVVPKSDLDWKGELLRHTTIPENKIDTWSGQKLPDPEAWVVIASLQSIYREGIYPPEVYARFACVVFDEVHRLGSDEFSAAIRKFPAMWRLGLSATPERRDGKMDLIHSHVGWRHVVGHTDAQPPDYYVIESDWTEPEEKNGKTVPYNPSRTNHAKRSLMADTIRNAKIAGAAYRAHKGGRRSIVFVEQIKHGARLRDALRAAGIPSGSIVEYNGDTKTEDGRKAKECPAGIILIATYKYTAEGTNIPALDTAILAHPIYDPRQPVGRILRKMAGKPKPIVLDVADRNSPTLSRIHSARWEYLRKLGAVWKGSFS